MFWAVQKMFDLLQQVISIISTKSDESFCSPTHAEITETVKYTLLQVISNTNQQSHLILSPNSQYAEVSVSRVSKAT